MAKTNNNATTQTADVKSGGNEQAGQIRPSNTVSKPPARPTK